jgi:acyl-CoA synthetase (AMP-forming)/AMP-acid ligase II
VLDGGVRDRPHAEALVDGRRRLTYQQLDNMVDGVVDGLAAEGLGAGDRLAVVLPNSSDVVVAMLASARLGALFVGINPGLHDREIEELLDGASTDLVIADAARWDGAGWSRRTLAIDLSTEGIAAIDGAPDTNRARRPIVTADMPVGIAFTSGTTGHPKGVLHDHRHALLPPSVILHDRMHGRGERIGVMLPLTTLNMMILGPMLAFLGGGTCVCIDTRDAAELGDRIERERIEHLSCSPATVHDLIESTAVSQRQLAGLRLGVGGATCPERLRSAYRERFGAEFTTGYGLSEAPTSVTQETERHRHRPGASGVAMAHVGVRVLDETGAELGVGEVGEIAVVPAGSGPWAGLWSGMLGYWNDPEATAKARRGTALLTGDEGSLDGDGYLYVADRRTNIINRGGSKVSPAEVERVLREHPAVADCIVLGRPERRLGEEVVAAVERRPGVDVDATQLLEHCSRSLARYKLPSEIAVTDRLARNAMGKIVGAAALELLDLRGPTGEDG